ncbi:MAG: hypothetical protein KAH44_32315 [Oricola sp.]|jgi:hypothetical protein|nr:hypothetical protein [Oricola sp.]
MTDDSNVVTFTGVTKNDFEPDYVLNAAVGRLDQVVIVGRTVDGDEYFASSHADGGIALWHLERARHRLMQIVDAEIG